jgi:Lon protease-like protein
VRTASDTGGGADEAMNIDTSLCDFSGLCRLFPLPNVVLFPHVILPLHIFEPRYRQLTEDALDGDGLMTIVQACPTGQDLPWIEPVPIEDVACVGKIVQHDRLPDGRFNLLLLGCRRVRLKQEVASPRLYRIAEGTLLEDEPVDDSRQESRRQLIELFLEIFQTRQRLDPDLSQLLDSDLPLGILSDIIAHALDLPASIKQVLLEETRVACRVGSLIAFLRDTLGRPTSGRQFPPPFSMN